MFDIQIEKLVRYSIFDIRTASVDHLTRAKTFFGLNIFIHISIYSNIQNILWQSESDRISSL